MRQGCARDASRDAGMHRACGCGCRDAGRDVWMHQACRWGCRDARWDVPGMQGCARDVGGDAGMRAGMRQGCTRDAGSDAGMHQRCTRDVGRDAGMQVGMQGCTRDAPRMRVGVQHPPVSPRPRSEGKPCANQLPATAGVLFPGIIIFQTSPSAVPRRPRRVWGGLVPAGFVLLFPEQPEDKLKNNQIKPKRGHSRGQENSRKVGEKKCLFNSGKPKKKKQTAGGAIEGGMCAVPRRGPMGGEQRGRGPPAGWARGR